MQACIQVAQQRVCFVLQVYKFIMGDSDAVTHWSQ